MEMKIKKKLKLSAALDEIARYADSLKSGGVEVNDRAVSPDDEVELEIEWEDKDGELELEFEITWKAEARKEAEEAAAEA